MSNLINLIKYISQKYPHKNELSNARLTKMIYLADWEFSKKYNEQITDIEWIFDNFGPYVSDIIDAATDDDTIEVIKETNFYGTPKTRIQYNGKIKNLDITDDVKDILKSVIKDTEKLSWNAFIKKVYNTYPIQVSPRYSKLDLPSLAKKSKG